MSALTFSLSSMMSLLEQLLLFEDDESEMLSVEIITYSHKHMDTHTRAARFNEIFANILGYTYTQVRIPKQAEVVLWVARLNVDLDNKNWHVCACVCARGFFSPHFIANISGVHMTCACLILYNNNTQKICQNQYIFIVNCGLLLLLACLSWDFFSAVGEFIMTAKTWWWSWWCNKMKCIQVKF